MTPAPALDLTTSLRGDLATRPTVGYKVRCLMAPLLGVLLATCMFHLLLQINVNAGCQKFMLGSLGGMFFPIPKLVCKSSGLGSGENLVFHVVACKVSTCRRAQALLWMWVSTSHRYPPPKFLSIDTRSTTRSTNRHTYLAFMAHTPTTPLLHRTDLDRQNQVTQKTWHSMLIVLHGPEGTKETLLTRTSLPQYHAQMTAAMS